MAYDRRFGEFVRELLGELGDLQIRPMFGGAGVSCGGLTFALIFEDMLYLKADATNQPDLAAAGAEQFTYSTKNGDRTAMAYWSLPDAAADDPQEAVRWARSAIEVAARKAQGKRRKS